jgi:hypothetical protein
MVHDQAWAARVALVLSGALQIWGVQGTVIRDPDDAGGFLLSAAAGPEMRIAHGSTGWRVSLRDPASGTQVPLGSHAGLPGLLRRLREELAPHAPAGRLVVGPQVLLGGLP